MDFNYIIETILEIWEVMRSKYGDELHRLTPTTVVDVAFIKDYIYFANVFSAFHEKGYNDSYKCRTSVKPYSLQNIIIQTYR